MSIILCNILLCLTETYSLNKLGKHIRMTTVKPPQRRLSLIFPEDGDRKNIQNRLNPEEQCLVIHDFITPTAARRSCTVIQTKVEVNQSHYRPEVPRGFQEVKVLRLRDNRPGWW